MKAQYKTLTGEDVPGAGGGRSKKDKKEKKKDEGKKEQSKKEQAAKKVEKQETKTEVDGAGGGKKITRLVDSDFKLPSDIEYINCFELSI